MTRDETILWAQPWTLGALDGLFDGTARQACATVLSEPHFAQSGPRREDHGQEWEFWEALASAAIRTALTEKRHPSPSAMLLSLVAYYERMLRYGEAGGLSLPDNPRARLAWVAETAGAIGVQAERAGASANMATAISQFQKDNQAKAAERRTPWREPARAFLLPLLTKRSWLSNDKAADALMNEAPDTVLSDLQAKNVPDRRSISAWIGAQRKTYARTGGREGLPPKAAKGQSSC